jgi:hypothetical protein
MATIFKDFYVMACHFSLKLSPKRGFDSAADYATNMCALWFIFALLLFAELVLPLFGGSMPSVQGSARRLVGMVVCIVLLYVISSIVSAAVRRIPTLRTQELVEGRYRSLSAIRRYSVLALVLGTPVIYGIAGWLRP